MTKTIAIMMTMMMMLLTVITFNWANSKIQSFFLRYRSDAPKFTCCYSVACNPLRSGRDIWYAL